MTHNLTEQNFDNEVLKSAAPVLVDFWAPWCGPCKIMSPVIDELADSYESSVMKFANVNVDENGALAGRFGIMSIPTFLIFKGGKIVAQTTGAQSKDKLKELVEKFKA